MSGAGYNDQGEIHIHKCDSLDRARESIYTLLEVRTYITDDKSCGENLELPLSTTAVTISDKDC